jgi:hypothetical protein
MRFDSQDHLYVASTLGREIIIIDPKSGKIMKRLGLPEIDLGIPDDLAFGPDGSLYWTSLVSGEVGRLSIMMTSLGAKRLQLLKEAVPEANRDEFIGALRSKPDIQQIPFAIRPARISTADDLAYWLDLLADEIKRRAALEEIPDAMFALHAVLETALQRLRGDWYH